MTLNKIRAANLLQRIFIKNYKSCYKEPNSCKFTRKRNKAKHVMKKTTVLKGNITTTYNENKHKNTGTSDLIHPN